MDKPVVDQTGLTDRYDFTLNWTPDQSQFATFGAHIPPPNPDDPNAPPSLFSALQEQLGLKMDVTKANVDVMVIDHIDKAFRELTRRIPIGTQARMLTIMARS